MPILPDWLLSRRSDTQKNRPKKTMSIKTSPHSNAPKHDESAQRDRARIIHCADFRRLQSKTQIHQPGENDFYRTRLTHSLEVAQIGSGICEQLRYNQQIHPEIKPWIASFAQMEAICLAHDIGHPPFGHGGEVALNSLMCEHGGFEGNGQTLRIVSKLGEYYADFGINVTRRTMLGLLKYPVLYKEVKNPINQLHHKPPKCIHDDELDVLTWILEPLSEADKMTFTQHDANKKSKYKSFDTSIMELADDIAYGVHDLEDALTCNLVTERQWQEEVIPNLIGHSLFAKFNPESFTHTLFSTSKHDKKLVISQLVSYFMKNIMVKEHALFSTPLLDLQAMLSEEAQSNLSVLKDFVYKYVIKTQDVKMLEHKGQHIIIDLFEAFLENPENLLPPSTYQKIQKEKMGHHRIICDYIAGMTDNYAVKTHQKLF